MCWEAAGFGSFGIRSRCSFSNVAQAEQLLRIRLSWEYAQFVEASERHCDPGRRTMRADAARNRAAIINAATEVLAQQGSAVDVREIARCSGVGMGTLYRHFPTKDDLISTVLREGFLAWAESARQVAADTEDPWAALVDFFESTLIRHAHHRALMECFAGNWSVPTAECTLLLRPVIDELLIRAHAAGVLRVGVTGEDLSLLLVSLGQTVQLTERCRSQMWRRLLRISLDGLRADHHEPLPSAAAEQ
jgi:AcrR family transcriptional regulator